MDIAYYPGCSLKQSSSLYDHQSRLVFEKLGVYLKEIEDWNCCGATSAGKTDDFLAMAMPARNLGLAMASGLGEMVIPCSACYSRTLVAQHYLEKHGELKAEINEGLSRKINGSFKVSSILEVLLKTLSSGIFSEKMVKKPSLLKPVCYYGCMMTRFPFDVPVPDDIENPQGMEVLLEAIGIHPIDWNYKTNCCGASAAVNDPETAMNLMGKIMKDAVSRGANCMVVTCPMCQLNLDAHQERFCREKGISERMPVLFITEVLGAAMNIDLKELQVDRHFVNAMDLFREMEDMEAEKKS